MSSSPEALAAQGQDAAAFQLQVSIYLNIASLAVSVSSFFFVIYTLNGLFTDNRLLHGMHYYTSTKTSSSYFVVKLAFQQSHTFFLGSLDSHKLYLVLNLTSTHLD